MIYRGSTGAGRREEIKHAFNEDPADNPVRILLATDAAREELNIQTSMVAKPPDEWLVVSVLRHQ